MRQYSTVREVTDSTAHVCMQRPSSVHTIAGSARSTLGIVESADLWLGLQFSTPSLNVTAAAGQSPVGNMAYEAVLPSWDPHRLLLCAAVTVGLRLAVTTLCWIFKVRYTRTMMPTLYFTIATLSLLTLYLGSRVASNHRKMLITALMVVYTVRLGLFLVFRALNIQGGSPASKKRTRPLSFWLMITSMSFGFSLPVVFCNSSIAPTVALGPTDIAFATVTAIGIIIEGVADRQKYTFRDNPKNEGKWCDVGLFKYAHHPHFFGDLCAWWGIFLLSMPTLEGLKWVALLSPLFETYVILVADGVPRLNTVHEMSYGKNPGFVEYKKSTSTLIPCPPWLYRKLARLF